jgi:phosphoadenosine phosphosulfate reductase
MKMLLDSMNPVSLAIDRLKKYEPGEGYWLAFSGGKDSQCIYHLAKMADVKFDAHYNITTVDPPELVRFIKHNYPDVKMEKPELTMWQLIPRTKIPPTRKIRYCCRALKERGGEGRVVLTGIRAEESYRRLNAWKIFNPIGELTTPKSKRNRKKTIINPILDWNLYHVWTYLEENKIDVCTLYDELDRLGCIGCPLQGGKGQLRDFARWPTYKKKYIKAFDQMVKNREKDKMKRFWRDGQDVFDWWIK